MFVERFMAWSVSVGVEQRVGAIGQLTEKYIGDKIATEDRRGTEQVFTHYLNDPSAHVRAALAEGLSTSKDVPRALIWSLLQDIAEVAAPLYRLSPLLRSADLVHAVRQGDGMLQYAVAQRHGLGEDAVRALVELADERAVLALLENPTVRLGPGLKHDLATRLGESPQIRGALLADETLLPATRQMLAQKLSGALVALVGEKGWTSNKRLADTAQDSTNRISVDIAGQTSREGMEAYVRHLIETGQMTPALLLRAICAGNALLFETAIAMLSGKSLKRVQAIVDEARISAFRALYSHTGLPESAYAVFVAAISAWQSGASEADVLDRIIARVEADESVDGALLALLGRLTAEAHRAVARPVNYGSQLLLAA